MSTLNQTAQEAPGRNSITATKARMAYLSAMRRAMCGNCKHAHEEDQRFSCGKAGFITTRWAVCNEHEHAREQKQGDKA
jgi:hypothetical protein